MNVYCIPMSIHQATDIPLNEIINMLPNGNGYGTPKDALNLLESLDYNVDYVFFRKRGRKRRELREAVRDKMLDKGTYIVVLAPPSGSSVAHAVCVRNGKISDNGAWFSKTPKSIYGRAAISIDIIRIAVKIKRGRRRRVSRAARIRRIHPDDLPYIY